MSTDHNFWREGRAEADSNRGPSAYHPNALPLGHTGSHLRYTCLTSSCLWRGTGGGRDTRSWGLGEVGGRGRTAPKATLLPPVTHTVTTRMICALRWAATRAILRFHWLWGKIHKTVSINSNFGRERRAESGNRTYVVRLPTWRPTWTAAFLRWCRGA